MDSTKGKYPEVTNDLQSLCHNSLISISIFHEFRQETIVPSEINPKRKNNQTSVSLRDWIKICKLLIVKRLCQIYFISRNGLAGP